MALPDYLYDSPYPDCLIGFPLTSRVTGHFKQFSWTMGNFRTKSFLQISYQPLHPSNSSN